MSISPFRNVRKKESRESQIINNYRLKQCGLLGVSYQTKKFKVDRWINAVVLQTLYQMIVEKRMLSWKAKLLIFCICVLHSPLEIMSFG